jgi:hypothetical protein
LSVEGMTPELEAELRAALNGDGPAYDPQTGERLEPLERLRRALTALGVPSDLVSGVTKRGEQNAAWDLHLTDGKAVELGVSEKLLTPRHVRARIFDATGEVMALAKPSEWTPVVKLIFAVAEVQNIAMSDLDEARYWITSFVELGGPGLSQVSLDDKEQFANALGSDRRHGLFVFHGSDDRLYLRQSSFYPYVRQTLGERLKTGEITERLGRLGFERKQPSVRIGDKVHKQRMFVSRPGFDPEA